MALSHLNINCDINLVTWLRTRVAPISYRWIWHNLFFKESAHSWNSKPYSVVSSDIVFSTLRDYHFASIFQGSYFSHQPASFAVAFVKSKNSFSRNGKGRCLVETAHLDSRPWVQPSHVVSAGRRRRRQRMNADSQRRRSRRVILAWRANETHVLFKIE